MSRKSARLLSRSKLRTCDTEPDIETGKRQKMETDQTAYPLSRSQQFRIETQLLPISQTHAVPSTLIIPSGTTMANAIDIDETDSLLCTETLSLPQPSCSGDSSSGDKDEVIHITTTPVAPPQQLYRFSNHFHTDLETLRPLLPRMDWADPAEMWDILDKKEERYPRSADLLAAHPGLRPYMRPVLYTWMMEVCDLHKLQKETFYLAMEFTDRYLLNTQNLPSSRLQLVGVSALLLASKVEEIYPPKIEEFAEVCDGAFDEAAILDCEMKMIKKLNWLLSPLTPHMWVQIFLQVRHIQEHSKQKVSWPQPGHFCKNHTPVKPSTSSAQENNSANPLMNLAECALATDSRQSSHASEEIGDSSACGGDGEDNCERHDIDTESCDEDYLAAWCSKEDKENEDENLNIVLPMYSVDEYMQVCQLLDLAMLDKHSFKFRYKVIAAAAVHLCTDVENICMVTGLTWPQLEMCTAWMKILLCVLRNHEPLPVTLKSYEKVEDRVAHLIQRCVIDRKVWEEALEATDQEFSSHSRLQTLSDTCTQELQKYESLNASSFVTPPRTAKKSSH